MSHFLLALVSQFHVLHFFASPLLLDFVSLLLIVLVLAQSFSSQLLNLLAFLLLLSLESLYFNLHWLRVPQRIVYKLCLVTYKALNDHRMPDYMSDFCIRVADKRLRSSSRNVLHVPRSSTKFGDCSFSIAGPTAWNSLPDHIKNASSLETFKSKLKTHLFKQ